MDMVALGSKGSHSSVLNSRGVANKGRDAYKAPLLSAEALWLSGQVTSDNLPVEPWSPLVSQVRHTQVEELLQGRYRTGYLLDGDLKNGGT